MKFSIVIVTVVMAITTGCSSKVGYFVTSYFDPLDRHNFFLNDKAHHLDYYTFRIGKNDPDTFLFFIGGSGCISYNYYLKRYLHGLKGEIQVFAIQKRGVRHRTTGVFGCSKDFYFNDYADSCFSDQQAFLTYVLMSSKANPKNIVVLGVSEGCETARRLAVNNQQITHLIMIGCGGMKFIDEMRLLLFDVDEYYQKVLDNPESTQDFIFGHTYKYWAHAWEEGQECPISDLLSIDIPILAVMGEQDRNVPIASIYFLWKKFNNAAKDNLTAIVYPKADHTLEAPHKNYREELMESMGTWIYNKPNFKTDWLLNCTPEPVTRDVQ